MLAKRGGQNLNTLLSGTGNAILNSSSLVMRMCELDNLSQKHRQKIKPENVSTTSSSHSSCGSRPRSKRPGQERSMPHGSHRRAFPVAELIISLYLGRGDEFIVE